MPTSPDISTREGVARMLADKVCENNLGAPYGGYSGKAPDQNGRVRHVSLFSAAARLDGSIEVYGIGFIRVAWKTTYCTMPEEGSRIFTLWEDAWEFLRLAFVELDGDSAMEVPVKEGTEEDG